MEFFLDEGFGLLGDNVLSCQLGLDTMGAYQSICDSPHMQHVVGIRLVAVHCHGSRHGRASAMYERVGVDTQVTDGVSGRVDGGRDRDVGAGGGNHLSRGAEEMDNRALFATPKVANGS